MSIQLPDPRYESAFSLELALTERRSIRFYTREELTLEEVSQLLWAAQGVTSRRSERAAPSAGGLYSLELYAVTGNVENLAPGVYHYEPAGHQMAAVIDGDVRAQLAGAALGQECIAEGAIDIVIAAVTARTTVKYGERGLGYVYMEAGHAAQNIYLQATAMKLGAVAMGAFRDEAVKQLLNLKPDEVPLYLIPVGRKA